MEEGEDDINGRTEKEMVEFQLRSATNHEKVRVRQLPCRGLSFQVWPAASALCCLVDDLLTRHHHLLEISPEIGHIRSKLREGKCEGQALRVLELGAGTGLVGIVAAMLGAHVTITDLPHVLPNLIHNACANEQAVRATARGGSVCVKALRWGEMDDAVHVGRNFDVVLASDVVYYDHLFDPLLLTIKWLLLGNDHEGSGNAILLLAHLRRWKKDSRFFNKAKKLFGVRIVHRYPPLPGSRVGVVVYCFSDKQRNNMVLASLP